MAGASANVLLLACCTQEGLKDSTLERLWRTEGKSYLTWTIMNSWSVDLIQVMREECNVAFK